MRPLLLLVGPRRTHDGAAQLRDLTGEVPARIPLVADDGLSAAKRPGEHEERHLPFRPVGRSQLDSPRSAVRGAEEMQAASPEPAGMAAGIAVAADVRESRASGGLDRTAAFDRGGVKQQEIVVCARALRAEDAEEPFDGSPRDGPGACDRRAEREDTGKRCPICRRAARRKRRSEGMPMRTWATARVTISASVVSPPGVSLPLWQKIIGCAINDGAEGVEVGVHRGLRADGVLDTVGFGPSASNPFFSAMFVASII